MLKNLKAVWANYAKAGALALVLARVIEQMDELNEYAAAIPEAEITVVRLTATSQTMLKRLHAREAGSAREWHLARADVLAEQLEADKIGHLVVENQGKSLRQVAEEVLQLARWPRER